MERKIEILANKQFEGNISLAIKHLLENHQAYNCDEYYSEFNDSEKTIAENILYDMTVEKFGKKAVKSDPMHYWQEMKKSIFPMADQQDRTLTKEKVLGYTLLHKKIAGDYAVKFGIFITIFIYTFAVPISILCQNINILLYPLPVIAVIFILCYILKFWIKKTLDKEHNMCFDIMKATCSSISYNSGYGENDFACTNICFDGYINYRTPEDLTSKIHVGTLCYLIRIDGETKKVFVADEWILDAELSNLLKQ